MRAVAAVVVPWLVWGVLDSGVYAALAAGSPGTFPAEGAPESASMLGLLLMLRVVYSVFAGWIAARLAAGRMNRVWMAIGLLLLTGVVVQAVQWALYPVWYHLLFLVSIVPAALAGARGGGSSAVVNA